MKIARSRIFVIAAVGVGLVTAVGLAGVVREAAEADEKPTAIPQRVFTDQGETVLRLDRATLARSGITTTPLAASDGATSTPVFATIVDTARLTDLANAWSVNSAQAAAARARATASAAALARTRQLYADAQNASLAQLQAAEAAYQTDRAGVEAAQAQATTAIASARQEFGSALLPGSPLVAAIVGRRLLLVQVALPADIDAAPATLTLEGDGGARATARFVGVAARSDPRVPGRGAYYVVPASSDLVPGMSVTADLPVRATGRAAAVPQSAIVDWQGKSWVYRRRADGAFARLPITADRRDQRGNFIVANLQPGTMIVTHGAQLLLSEELRGNAPAADSDD
ncbi:hypothetical protein [uncultured Sphingomonas sp.]|uniref:hypothetical protein n=1 Tax=uncultured Sphingomonas sp. TaxID=158754 RepID=UPI002638FF4B|nr:hypothetical protein [uncultured Sphingomonas sp.]